MEFIEVCQDDLSNYKVALDKANKLISDQCNQIEVLEAMVDDAQKKLFALKREIDALKQYIGNQAIERAYVWGQDYLDRTLHENPIKITP
jgi:peptidoglycan hydrolase CwlO-like protein